MKQCVESIQNLSLLHLQFEARVSHSVHLSLEMTFPFSTFLHRHLSSKKATDRTSINTTNTETCEP